MAGAYRRGRGFSFGRPLAPRSTDAPGRTGSTTETGRARREIVVTPSVKDRLWNLCVQPRRSHATADLAEPLRDPLYRRI